MPPNSMRVEIETINLVVYLVKSASLGMPRAKNEAATTESPAHSHKLCASQGISGELYSMLLGKVREKLLTANNRLPWETKSQTVVV
jgi:hypothetical protein